MHIYGSVPVITYTKYTQMSYKQTQNKGLYDIHRHSYIKHYIQTHDTRTLYRERCCTHRGAVHTQYTQVMYTQAFFVQTLLV